VRCNSIRNLSVKLIPLIFFISLGELTGKTSLFQESAQGQLIINEIMQNPDSVSDANGEWFEIYNPNLFTVNLIGWTIKDLDNDEHTIDSSLMVPADGFVVLGRNKDFSTNGGVVVNDEYSGITLGNTSDELIIYSPDSTFSDTVIWDDGETFPDPTGASMALIDATFDNNMGLNWIESIVEFGDGDRGTPGFANDFLTVQNEIVNSPFNISIFPNPFNQEITIQFSNTKQEWIKISLFDILGNEIFKQGKKLFDAGNHELNWKSIEMDKIHSSGIYFIHFGSTEWIETKKLLFLK